MMTYEFIIIACSVAQCVQSVLNCIIGSRLTRLEEIVEIIFNKP